MMMTGTTACQRLVGVGCMLSAGEARLVVGSGDKWWCVLWLRLAYQMHKMPACMC